MCAWVLLVASVVVVVEEGGRRGRGLAGVGLVGWPYGEGGGGGSGCAAGGGTEVSEVGRVWWRELGVV